MKCNHEHLKCLNEYEIIRKYRCEDCGEVMLCGCEEKFGTRFLPHQLNQGRDSETAIHVPVTIGFQQNICRECRGLPIKAFPKAEIYGCGTKIKRYYWRELLKRELELFGEWAFAHNIDPVVPVGEKAILVQKQAAEQALSEIKHLHATAPKYMWFFVFFSTWVDFLANEDMLMFFTPP